jgi:hypothetical protein
MCCAVRGTKGKTAANAVHFKVGRKVRETIKDLGGTMPEDLPTIESIKKLEAKKKKELGGKPATDLLLPDGSDDSDK